MTELERQEFINKYWIKFNRLYPEVKEEYEINTLTKVVKNVKTNNICSWLDTGNTTIGKRVCLVKNNGKLSSYYQTSVNKLIRNGVY